MGQCCSGRTLSDDQKAAKKDAKFKEGLINKTTSSATSSSAVLGTYKPTRTRNHCLIPPIFNDLPHSTRIDGEGTYVRRSTLFRCVATMVRTCFAHASGPTTGGGWGNWWSSRGPSPRPRRPVPTLPLLYGNSPIRPFYIDRSPRSVHLYPHGKCAVSHKSVELPTSSPPHPCPARTA